MFEVIRMAQRTVSKISPCDHPWLRKFNKPEYTLGCLPCSVKEGGKGEEIQIGRRGRDKSETNSYKNISDRFGKRTYCIGIRA